jgi:hypothetical protein
MSRVAGAIPLEKLISVALVVAALVMLPPLEIQEAIIVFGQGHFLACYYYQYKYHKIDRPYLLRYFTSLILIFGAYILYPNLFLLVTVASVWFVIHLSVDERFLWKDPPNLQRGLALLPFLLLYTALIVDSIYVGHVNIQTASWIGPAQELVVPILGTWVSPYGLMAAGAALVIYLLYIRMRPSRMQPHDVYFLLGTAVLAVLFSTGHAPSHYYLMGSIILFHYSSWYVHYGVKWKDDKPRRNRYILDMLVVNALVFGIYAIYRWMPQALVVEYIPRYIFPFKDPVHGNILASLFSPGYFYLWTLMHFISTARLSDVGYFKETNHKGDRQQPDPQPITQPGV